MTARRASDAYLREWAEKKIDDAAEQVRQAQDGERHNTRLDMARLLGGLVPYGLATEDEIERRLYDANVPATQAQHAERKAIRDGIRMGIQRPLELPPAPPQPLFDSAGYACCPSHQVRLPKAKNGNGYKCHERDASTESGFCGFWWKGDGYIEPRATQPAIPGVTVEYRAVPKMPIDSNDLLALERRPVKWFAPSFLREGLGLLVGLPQVGKTPLAIQLAISIATGSKWMGRVACRKAKVLYLGVEYTAQELIPLLDISRCGVTIPRGMLTFKTMEDEFPLETDAALEELDWYIRVLEVEVIIIDVLTAFLPPEKFKQNLYRGDYTELKPYHRLASLHSAAILGTWHGSKRETDPRIMYNGGVGMWAVPSSRMALYTDLENRVRLSSFPRLSDRLDWALTQERTKEGRRWVVADAAPEPLMSDTERVIWRWLRENAGPASPKQPLTIAEMTGIVPNTVRVTLRRMFEKNLLHQGAGGSYYLEPVTSVTLETDETPVTPVTHLSYSDLPHQEGVNGQSYKSYSVTQDTSVTTPLDSLPPSLRESTKMMLQGNLTANQKMARERCEEYGLDYEALRNWAREEYRNDQAKKALRE